MIHLQKGDITKLEVDAIVNAANSLIKQNKDQIKKTSPMACLFLY